MKLQIQGVPREFDAFLRPPARVAQVIAGLLLSLVLLWLGDWWWAPVPLAASFVFYEWFFSTRADKPLQITLEPERVHLVDRFLETERTLDLSAAHAATLVYRQAPDDQIDAVLTVSDPDQVCLAVQFLLPARGFEPEPHDVDADLCQAVLGSISGLIRALAPREVLIRQVVKDPAALQWFRAHLPAEAFQRTAVRVWRGKAPDLDLFGYHAGPPDGMLHLEGTQAHFPGLAPATFQAVEPEVAERTAVLFRMNGEEHEDSEERLPLWVHSLGGQRLAIPAPLAPGRGEPMELADDLWHLHAPEGAAILWHLWRHLPEDSWPEAWHDALIAARPLIDPWPAAIPDPV